MERPPVSQKPPDFSLGNYWIVTSYLFAIFFTPLALVVSILAQAADRTLLGPGSLAISLLILLLSLTLVASAWGLQQRIIWGVYFAYVFLATEFILALGFILHSFLSFMGDEPIEFLYFKILVGSIFIILPFAWWRYFASREELFE